MILTTIQDINTVLAATLAETSLNAQVEEIAKPAYSQQDKAPILYLPFSGKPLTLDGSKGFQSFHLLQGGRVVDTQFWGSSNDNRYDLEMVLVAAGKTAVGLTYLLNALAAIDGVQTTRFENETLEVLRRYWQVKTDDKKNYDPALWAWAVRYTIEGVDDTCLTAFLQEIESLTL